MNNAPHLQDGFASILGGVKRRQAKQIAMDAANAMKDQKQSHASAIEKAKQEAYTNAMLDFMYASTVQQDKMALQSDQMDLNTPLPTMDQMG